MSEISLLNSMLHREISHGKSFDALIPKRTCEAKSIGEGDTYFSVEAIVDVIKKHHKQLIKIAPLLKKSSDAQTVQSNYNWLYKHFQYKADAIDQNLRSPACSWFDRYNGIDCKSYTILAGSLLLLQNLSFYVRKIKQPGYNSEGFSHVYIVVPKDQKTGSLKKGYYVIDPTKHSNTEATYTIKKDVYMSKLPHNVLNAPHTTGASCTQPSSAISQEAYSNFLAFLKLLFSAGVPMQALEKIKNTIDHYIKLGIDPPVYPLIQNVSSTGAMLGGSYYSFNQKRGLMGDEPVVNDETKKKIGEAIAEFGKDLLKGDFISNTFGAVFGNGWRLGCWNTATNPRESEAHVSKDAIFLLENSGLTQNVTQQTWNNYVLLVERYKQGLAHLYNQSKYSKCSRDGWRAAKEGMQAFETQIRNQLSSSLQAVGGSLSVGTIAMRSNPGFYNDLTLSAGWRLQSPPNIMVPIYKLVQGTQTVTVNPVGVTTKPSGSKPSNSKPNIFTTIFNPGTPSSITPQSGKFDVSKSGTGAKQLGGGWIMPLVLIGIAGGAYYFSKQKTSPKIKPQKA